MKSGGNGPKFAAYQTVRIGGAPDLPSVLPGICNKPGGASVYCGEGGEDLLFWAEADSGTTALKLLGQKLDAVCTGTHKSCEPIGSPRIGVSVVPATGFARWFGDLIHPLVK